MFIYEKICCMLLALVLVLSAFLASADPNTKADDLHIVILHNNDIHGRFEETGLNSGTCRQAHKGVNCVGGIARTAHVIRDFRSKAANGTSPPVLYLNAGDIFAGTAWFSLFSWNISAAFLNKLKPDAISLGNHEFDLTPRTLGRFVKALNSPVLAANLNFSKEPSLQSIKSSVVLEISGRKIGIIGYLTPNTVKLSSVGKVTFEDEIIAITREAQLLANQGVNIIIAIGHSGYQMDKTIAREVELVDIVIGGHSHSFLWNGTQPSTEAIEGPYPKVITQVSGKNVPVVQAYAYTKYLGVLNCTFNVNGDLTHFAGQPMLLDNSIPQDEDVLQLLEVYRPAVDKLNGEIIGTSRVTLDGSKVCRHRECNFGNLITDAFVNYVTSLSTETWTNVPIGLFNGGAIRNSIVPYAKAGKITRGELVGVFPFGDQVIVLTLKGLHLKMILEQMVRSNGETSLGEFPQISGIRMVLDMDLPTNSRVVSIKVRCGICKIPVYEPLDLNKYYTLATSSFLADGGDGITVLRDYAINKKIKNLGDIDAVARYIQLYSPVYPEVQGRIEFIKTDQDYGSTRVDNWFLFMLGFVLSNVLN